jgi:hypothetical protein
VPGGRQLLDRGAAEHYPEQRGRLVGMMVGSRPREATASPGKGHGLPSYMYGGYAVNERKRGSQCGHFAR